MKTNLFFLIVIILIALTQSAFAYEPVFTVNNVDDNTLFYNGYDDFSFGVAEGAGAGGKNVNENQVRQRLNSISKPPIGTNSQEVSSCYYGSYTVPEDGWYEVSYTGSMYCERMSFGTEAGIPIFSNEWSVNVDIIWEDIENLERIESMSKEYNFWARSRGIAVETAEWAAIALSMGATGTVPAVLQSISSVASATETGSAQLLSILETIDDWQFHNTETITKTTTKYLEAGQTYQWMWGVQTQLTTDTLLENPVWAYAYTQLSLDSITVTPLFALTYTVTPTHGPNGSISPRTDFTAEYGEDVTFTATPNSGYVVDSWYVNGENVGGGANSLLVQNINEDKVVLVTFKLTSTGSQVYVAGSLNPSMITTSMAAGGSGKYWDIPVQNKNSFSVPVNATLSGNAAAWASMTSSNSSFTLAPNETKTSRVTVFVPSGVSAGTYTLNVSYNGTVLTFSIIVTVPGQDYEDIIDPGPATIGGPNWRAYDVDIPVNVWNDVDDGFYDTIRLYAHVDSVSIGGTLQLYDAGFNYLMSNTGINPTSRVGDDINWPISKYRLDQNDNTFGIAGPAGINLQLSNFRFVITFYTEAPDIIITKSLI
jgi:hypothetical protein